MEQNSETVKPIDVCNNQIKCRYVDLCKTELKARPKQTVHMTSRQVGILLSDVKRESVPLAIPEKNPVLKYMEAEMTPLMTL